MTSRPWVSVRMWRLRPVMFFPAAYPLSPPFDWRCGPTGCRGLPPTAMPRDRIVRGRPAQAHRECAATRLLPASGADSSRPSAKAAGHAAEASMRRPLARSRGWRRPALAMSLSAVVLRLVHPVSSERSAPTVRRSDRSRNAALQAAFSSASGVGSRRWSDILWRRRRAQHNHTKAALGILLKRALAKYQ